MRECVRAGGRRERSQDYEWAMIYIFYVYEEGLKEKRNPMMILPGGMTPKKIPATLKILATLKSEKANDTITP